MQQTFMFKMSSDTPITISYSSLISGDSDHLLPSAFGPDSLGIIVVSNLPSEFAELRSKALSGAGYLARLEKEKLESLEDPENHYLNGFSLGKERLRSGKPDMLKGSFYANCSFYNENENDDNTAYLEKYKDFTAYTASAVWPKENDLPHFKENVQKLCKLMIQITEDVARAIDRLFGSNGSLHFEGYQDGYLQHIVSTSKTTKARLLHYYPPSPDAKLNSESDDSWCGEHFDFSSLTALTSAQFVDESDPENVKLLSGPDALLDSNIPLKELDSSPDPTSGLYIKSRSGKVVQVKIPRDCLAFQTGSALQEVTENKFKAVPHYVKGVGADIGEKGKYVARNTLAVFCQPSLNESVGPNYVDFADYSKQILKSIH